MFRCFGSLVLLLAMSRGLSADDISGSDRFFESRVRPLLISKCGACHGEKKQEAGLRLDRGDFVTKGSDYGPAVIPGKPEESRLIEVLLHSEFDTAMPPKEKLADADIDVMRRWIREGAVWPKTQGSDPQPTADPAETHWAFQPMRRLDPSVEAGDSQANRIDAFIDMRLEENDLTAGPRAGRRTLIRRLSFTLRGLPPTHAEVEKFVNTTDPTAWAQLVDQYLSSPEYGERWGRHWLDIARYGDTKGYVFQEERRYAHAWTYRNYVIDSLNRDRPFDQFVTEQLAADRLELPEGDERLAALGFLTTGPRFRNNTHEIIDNRIDTVSRGLMGLTVSCARCHDHKYDPIPTADYYSLYGVFASSQEPQELPVIGDNSGDPGYPDFLKQLAKANAEIDRVRSEEAKKLLNHAASNVDRILRRVLVEKDGKLKSRLVMGDSDLHRGLIARWRGYLDQQKRSTEPIWQPWVELANVPANAFPDKLTARLAVWIERKSVHPALLENLRTNPPTDRWELAVRYGNLFRAADGKSGDGTESKSALPISVLRTAPGPLALSDEQAERLFNRKSRNRIRSVRKKRDALFVTHPAGPPRAMIIEDRPQPVEPVVFLRGNSGRRGPKVPRRFPTVLSDVREAPFDRGSGRRQLAEAITSANNPLTARVLVNRVWMHHFGQPLVESLDDFGLRSSPPSHPLLLDDLALRLIDHGWSLKWLHREILMSETWRRTSVPTATLLAKDPENRWLARQNRRRLGFEGMRDSILSVSASLVAQEWGRPVPHTANASETRRTVYLTVDRNNLPELFRTFDFANPDQTTARRSETTVPQQALFAMNSPFVLQRADALARMASADGSDDESGAATVRSLYQRVLQRDPSDREQERAVAFLRSGAGEDEQIAVSQLAQVLLLSNEFWFVD